jgi:hypothetical protein
MNIFCNYVVVLSYAIRPGRDVSFSELAAVQGKIAYRSVNNHRNFTRVSVLYDNLYASVYCSPDCCCLHHPYKWLCVLRAAQLL